MQLNYHHLRYFREVALEGNLSRAAERMNVSQSALSIQIKQLEDRLGHALFDRRGRRMTLTEAGRIALDHAHRIFAAGDDLVATLNQYAHANPPLRVGAASTLSRNFQMRFLQPVLDDGQTRIMLRSGNLDTLYSALAALAIDIVLTTEIRTPEENDQFEARLIDQQPISLIGRPDLIVGKSLEDILQHVPLIVPTETSIRAGLAALSARLGISPIVAAEVDDMAMVRLLCRQGAGVAFTPGVVLADEIAAGIVVQADFDLGLTENFYAVTIKRQFPHPWASRLVSQYK